uniref:Uncharacterized protein n=1 Tax=viral metagenome TaxID=1070528 RepID=A0A2V0RAK7_9ZZZZ
MLARNQGGFQRSQQPMQGGVLRLQQPMIQESEVSQRTPSNIIFSVPQYAVESLDECAIALSTVVDGQKIPGTNIVLEDGLEAPGNVPLRPMSIEENGEVKVASSGHRMVTRNNPDFLKNQAAQQAVLKSQIADVHNSVSEIRETERLLLSDPGQTQSGFYHIRSRSIWTCPFLAPGVPRGPTASVGMRSQGSVTWELYPNDYAHGGKAETNDVLSEPRGTIDSWNRNVEVNWVEVPPEKPAAMMNVNVTMPDTNSSIFNKQYGKDGGDEFWRLIGQTEDKPGQWIIERGRYKNTSSRVFVITKNGANEEVPIKDCILITKDAKLLARQHARHKQVQAGQWVRDVDVSGRYDISITSRVIGAHSLGHDIDQVIPDATRLGKRSLSVVCSFLYRIRDQAWKYVVRGELSGNNLVVTKVITIIYLSLIIPTIRSAFNVHIAPSEKDPRSSIEIIPYRYEERSLGVIPTFQYLERLLSKSAYEGRGWLGMRVDDKGPLAAAAQPALQRISIDIEEFRGATEQVSVEDMLTLFRRLSMEASSMTNEGIIESINDKLCVFVGQGGKVFLPEDKWKIALTDYHPSFEKYPYYFTAEDVLRKMYYARTAYVIEKSTVTNSELRVTRAHMSKISREALQTPVCITKRAGYLVYTATPAIANQLRGTVMGERMQARGGNRNVEPKFIGSVYSYPTKPKGSSSAGDFRSFEHEFADELGQRFALGDMVHDMAHVCHTAFRENSSIANTSVIMCPSFAIIMVRTESGTRDFTYKANVIVGPRVSRLVASDSSVNMVTRTAENVLRNKGSYKGRVSYAPAMRQAKRKDPNVTMY